MIRNQIHTLAIAGLVLSAVGVGADLIGIGGQAGFGTRQFTLFGAGLSVTVLGILLDMTMGHRRSREWFVQILSRGDEVGRFLVIGILLGLLVLVIRQYELESQAFYSKILILTFFGFVIHNFLPDSYRLPFFLLLSLAGITGVFGILNGTWLITIGIVLIAICHLPVSFGYRVALLIMAGTALAVLRTGRFDAPWSVAIWPILASMFMFRVIIYMYDLKHQSGKSSFWHTLSYFFLLPNTVFPFFPVIDFTQFRQTYFNDDRYLIYRKGVVWMLRGVTQLILYRLVYYYFVMPAEEVAAFSDLVRFLVSNFLLYLRISGMFHLIVGMLHLFGFNLPETNHRYCLSSSFIDFWRRINIYWKDFMQKVFFNPIAFRFRHLGLNTSLVIATIIVFLVTWALHAYQWFWIRGSYLLSTTDILFWSILASLVVANYVYRSKFGARRPPEEGRVRIGDSASIVLRTLGTFTTICLLWSLWTSATLSEWFGLWMLGEEISGITVLSCFAILVGAVGAVHGFRAVMRAGIFSRVVPESPSFSRFALSSGLKIVFLYLIVSAPVNSLLGERGRDLVRDLQTNRLSRKDEQLMVRGYYEDLTNVNRFNSQLWEVYMLKPEEWPNLWDVDAVSTTGDFLRYELRPSLDILFRYKNLRTNRWGMRDRECEIEPPPSVHRIAMTGASHVMGSGVGNEESFEFLLENLLNQVTPVSSDLRYEILNFGVDGYNPLQQLFVLETKVLSFQPSIYFYVAHENEGQKALNFLAERERSNVDIPYDYLQELVDKTGISSEPSREGKAKKLRSHDDEIINWLYGRIVTSCRENGIRPVWIFLPDKVGSTHPYEAEKIARMAEKAGFQIVNLHNVYEDQDVESLRLTAWDYHPNEGGHRLIANRLYEELLEAEGIL